MKALFFLVLSVALPMISCPVNSQQPNKNGGIFTPLTLSTKYGFSRVFIILLENTSYQKALTDPTLTTFAAKGALLSNYFAIGHPSEPDYLALTSGSTNGVTDDGRYTVDARHIGDLLDAKGLTWKNYAEAFVGNCTRGSSPNFADRHVPFLSYKDVNTNPTRCNAHIVNAEQLAIDLQNNTLPNYSFYTPDLINDGHDTNVTYAGKWFAATIVPLLENPNFIKDTLVVVTFDENDGSGINQVFTALYGSMIQPGVVIPTKYDHYSLLKTIESNFGLGDLGQEDALALEIQDGWN